MDINILIEYHNWANTIYLDYIKGLSDDELNDTIHDYSKSIRDILEHLYGTYWFWFTLITDKNWDKEPEWNKLDKDGLIHEIEGYSEKLLDFINHNDITEPFSYTEGDKEVTTTVENILFNFVTHAAYHRGQLAIYLRILGIKSIEETDFNPFILSKQTTLS